MKPRAEQVHSLYESALNLKGEESATLLKAVEITFYQDTFSMTLILGLFSFACSLSFVALSLAIAKQAPIKTS